MVAGISDLYYKIEDRWYDLLDWVEAKGVPIYKVIDPLEDRGVPSLPVFVGLFLISIWLLLSLIGPGPFAGQAEMPFSVQLSDSSGNALAGATIKIDVGGSEVTGRTNHLGIWKYSLPPGEYGISAESPNCDTIITVKTISEADQVIQLMLQCRVPQAKAVEVCLKSASGEISEKINIKRMSGLFFTGHGSCEKASACGIDLDADSVYSFESKSYELKDPISGEGIIAKASKNECIILAKKAGVDVENGVFVVRLQHPDGSLVPWQMVQLAGPENGYVISTRRTGSSEPDIGLAKFDDVAVGTKFRIVVPAGAESTYYESAETYEMTRDAQQVTITIDTGADSIINVQRKIGEVLSPLQGVSVSIFKIIEPKDKFIGMESTDKNGAAHIRLTKGEEYRVTLFKLGYKYLEGKINGGGEETFLMEQISQEEVGNLEVYVSIKDVGDPVDNAILTLKSAEGELKTGYGMLRTNEDGYAAYSYVLPGSYCVTVLREKSEETRCSENPAEVKAGETTTMTIQVPPITYTLKTRIRLDGANVQGASVAIKDAYEEKAMASKSTVSGYAGFEGIAEQTKLRVYVSYTHTEFEGGRKIETLYRQVSDVIDMTENKEIEMNLEKLRTFAAYGGVYQKADEVGLERVLAEEGKDFPVLSLDKPYYLKMRLGVPEIENGAWDSIIMGISESQGYIQFDMPEDKLDASFDIMGGQATVAIGEEYSLTGNVVEFMLPFRVTRSYEGEPEIYFEYSAEWAKGNDRLYDPEKGQKRESEKFRLSNGYSDTYDEGKFGVSKYIITLDEFCGYHSDGTEDCTTVRVKHMPDTVKLGVGESALLGLEIELLSGSDFTGSVSLDDLYSSLLMKLTGSSLKKYGADGNEMFSAAQLSIEGKNKALITDVSLSKGETLAAEVPFTAELEGFALVEGKINGNVDIGNYLFSVYGKTKAYLVPEPESLNNLMDSLSFSIRAANEVGGEYIPTNTILPISSFTLSGAGLSGLCGELGLEDHRWVEYDHTQSKVTISFDKYCRLGSGNIVASAEGYKFDEVKNSRHYVQNCLYAQDIGEELEAFIGSKCDIEFKASNDAVQVEKVYGPDGKPTERCIGVVKSYVGICPAVDEKDVAIKFEAKDVKAIVDGREVNPDWASLSGQNKVAVYPRSGGPFEASLKVGAKASRGTVEIPITMSIPMIIGGAESCISDYMTAEVMSPAQPVIAPNIPCAIKVSIDERQTMESTMLCTLEDPYVYSIRLEDECGGIITNGLNPDLGSASTSISDCEAKVDGDIAEIACNVVSFEKAESGAITALASIDSPKTDKELSLPFKFDSCYPAPEEMALNLNERCSISIITGGTGESMAFVDGSGEPTDECVMGGEVSLEIPSKYSGCGAPGLIGATAPEGWEAEVIGGKASLQQNGITGDDGSFTLKFESAEGDFSVGVRMRTSGIADSHSFPRIQEYVYNAQGEIDGSQYSCESNYCNLEQALEYVAIKSGGFADDANAEILFAGGSTNVNDVIDTLIYVSSDDAGYGWNGKITRQNALKYESTAASGGNYYVNIDGGTVAAGTLKFDVRIISGYSVITITQLEERRELSYNFPLYLPLTRNSDWNALAVSCANCENRAEDILEGLESIVKDSMWKIREEKSVPVKNDGISYANELRAVVCGQGTQNAECKRIKVGNRNTLNPMVFIMNEGATRYVYVVGPTAEEILGFIGKVQNAMSSGTRMTYVAPTPNMKDDYSTIGDRFLACFHDTRTEPWGIMQITDSNLQENLKEFFRRKFGIDSPPLMIPCTQENKENSDFSIQMMREAINFPFMGGTYFYLAFDNPEYKSLDVVWFNGLDPIKTEDKAQEKAAEILKALLGDDNIPPSDGEKYVVINNGAQRTVARASAVKGRKGMLEMLKALSDNGGNEPAKVVWIAETRDAADKCSIFKDELKLEGEGEFYAGNYYAIYKTGDTITISLVSKDANKYEIDASCYMGSTANRLDVALDEMFGFMKSNEDYGKTYKEYVEIYCNYTDGINRHYAIYNDGIVLDAKYPETFYRDSFYKFEAVPAASDIGDKSLQYRIAITQIAKTTDDAIGKFAGMLMKGGHELPSDYVSGREFAEITRHCGDDIVECLIGGELTRGCEEGRVSGPSGDVDIKGKLVCGQGYLPWHMKIEPCAHLSILGGGSCRVTSAGSSVCVKTSAGLYEDSAVCIRDGYTAKPTHGNSDETLTGCPEKAPHLISNAGNLKNIWANGMAANQKDAFVVYNNADMLYIINGGPINDMGEEPMLCGDKGVWGLVERVGDSTYAATPSYGSWVYAGENTALSTSGRKTDIRRPLDEIKEENMGWPEKLLKWYYHDDDDKNSAMYACGGNAFYTDPEWFSTDAGVFCCDEGLGYHIVDNYCCPNGFNHVHSGHCQRCPEGKTWSDGRCI